VLGIDRLCRLTATPRGAGFHFDLSGSAFDFTNMSETTTSAGEWTVTIDANTQAMLNVIYGQAQAFATSVSVVWDNKL
jgi:hypothetical protein